jgi:hypothetical protein
MPQSRRQIRLAVEALAKVRVRRNVEREQFQRVAARKPGMLGKIYLAHAPGAEQTQDTVAGEFTPLH